MAVEDLSKSPLTAEVATVARDPMIPQFQVTLDPQDETLAAKGGAKGIGIYDEIRRDPHAHAVLQKRTLEVTSREWRVEPASDRRADRKVAELVESQLKAIAFDRLTAGLMGAVLKGYAVAEVIWELRAGIWTVVRVKVRRQRRFRFSADGELRLLTRDSGFDGVPLPDRKFIVHRYSIEHDDDDPYGLGLGSVLFWPAWFKRQVLSHWLRSSEKLTDPTVHATYPGGYDEGKQARLLAAIRQMGRDAGIATPEGVEIELLEADSARNDGQAALTRYLDEMMSEAVLGETLTTSAGDNGSRALGEVHADVRTAIAKADADLVSATLNETLVRWIVELNMPGAGLPTVWRSFEDQPDLDAQASRDKTLSDMGYRPRSVDYVNETYGGDWVDTREAQPGDGIAAAAAAALDAATPAFAEAAGRRAADLDPMVARLEAQAAPAIDAMLAKIRAALDASSSYEEFAEALLTISPSLDLDALASVLEPAFTAADLAGRATVAEGG